MRHPKNNTTYYGNLEHTTLLVQSRMKGETFGHITNGFDLSKAKEPRVEAEEQAMDQTAPAPTKPKGAGRPMEKTTKTKVWKDAPTACNDLAMHYVLMVEEQSINLGESEEPKVEEEHATSGFDLGKSEEAQIEVEEHAMSSFDPGESEGPKDTKNLAHNERHKTEDGAFKTLDKNNTPYYINLEYGGDRTTNTVMPWIGKKTGGRC